MACPRCGGLSRHQLAHGYWECTTVWQDQVPTGAHPSGAQGPAYALINRTCGFRYQEAASGAAVPVCGTCSMYSVGLCADCGIAQCGSCGRRYDGQFLCDDCRLKRIEVERV